MELNRTHFAILKVLSNKNCIDFWRSATCRELMDVIGLAKVTTNKRLRELQKVGYVERGCKSVNANTWYLTDKGKDLISIKKGAEDND